MWHVRDNVWSFLAAFSLFAFFSSAHAQAPTLTPIHIGVSTNTATWFPLYVAWEKGLFGERALALLPIYRQARPSPAALASKQTAYTPKTASSLTAMGRGLPARLILI